MMTKKCGDCIHADICKEVNGGWFSPKNPAYCKGFKDRTNFVEVVRCKDCKRSGMYAFGDGSNGEHLACLTIEDDGFVRFATSVEPNHFCGYGERKDNEKMADK